ncbi:MAG: hypothetical protein ACJAUZ_002153, partial [Flavobacteriaceae bacterium]
ALTNAGASKVATATALTRFFALLQLITTDWLVIQK